MSSIAIPDVLPMPQTGSYAIETMDHFRQFEPEVGPRRVRRRVRKPANYHSLTWSLTQAQYQVFDIWWERSLESGTREFDLRLIGDDLVSLEWFEAQFVAPYEASVDLQGNWIVQARVRILLDSMGPVRTSGTNALSLQGDVDAASTCALQVTTSLRASGEVLVETSMRLGSADLRLASTPDSSGTARLS